MVAHMVASWMGVNMLSAWPMAVWEVTPSVHSTPWFSRYSWGLDIIPVASPSSTPVVVPKPKYSA